MAGLEEQTETDLFINTRGHCFLCLIKLERRLEGASVSASSPSNDSFQWLSLSSYLGLTIDKWKGLGEVGIITSSSLKLKVSLCEVCAPINEQFLEVYEQLKRIETEVASCLNRVRDEISRAEATGLASQWRELGMETGRKGFDGEEEDLEIVEKLRMETVKKCSLKLATLSPELKQTRTIKTEEVRKDSRIRQSVGNNRSDPHFSPDDDDENDDDGSDSDYSDASFQNMDDDEDYQQSSPESDSTEGEGANNDVTERGGQPPQDKTHVKASSSSRKVGRPKSRINPESTKHKCRLCPKAYRDARSLRDHHNCVHLNIRYECTICNKEFRCRKYYKRHHREFHMGVSAKSFKCPKCKGIFTLKSELREHRQTSSCKAIITKPSKPIAKHSCSICGKQFNTKSHVQKHMNGVHLNLREFVCGQCGKGFGTPDHLQRHMRSIHFKVRNHMCDQCGKGFATNYHLQTHRTTVHTDLPRDIICDQCGKGFTTSNILRKHVHQVHLRVRDYACDLCEESFVGKVELNRHRREVHGEDVKPRKEPAPRKKNHCPCTLCDKVFNQNHDLKRHVQAVHLQLREHGCDKCHWAFKRKRDLMKHRCKALRGVKRADGPSLDGQ